MKVGSPHHKQYRLMLSGSVLVSYFLQYYGLIHVITPKFKHCCNNIHNLSISLDGQFQVMNSAAVTILTQVTQYIYVCFKWYLY